MEVPDACNQSNVGDFVAVWMEAVSDARGRCVTLASEFLSLHRLQVQRCVKFGRREDMISVHCKVDDLREPGPTHCPSGSSLGRPR